MRHIHIVDADPASRAATRALLAGRTDLVIRYFTSPCAFLEREAELDAGVLLLPSQAPDADEPDVLRALSAVGARHAPVVLTAPGDVGAAVAAMKAGAVDCVPEPRDPDRLLAAIDDAFANLEARAAAQARVRAARARIDALSPREGDVLRGLMEGQPNKVIAGQLALSPRTVEIHRANLLEKLSARSLPEALRVAWAAGLYAE